MKTVAICLISAVFLLVIVEATILSITVDDQLAALYIDGAAVTNLPNAKSYTTPDTVTLPDGTQLIAVQGVNLQGFTGVIASTSDGSFVTNTSWKCAGVLSDNWYGVNFDDSGWPAAAVSKPNDGSISGISKSANFIWTTKPDYNTGDKIAYCRGYINSLTGQAGSTYTRWGRTSCPGATLLYTGYMANAHYAASYTGGGSNFLCLNIAAKYGTHSADWYTNEARVYAVQYGFFSSSGGFDPFLHDNVNGSVLSRGIGPCAVCYVPRSAQFQMQNSNSCPTGWTLEYSGYMAGSHQYYTKSEHICVDQAPEMLGYFTASADWGAAAIYPLAAHCFSGGLPCGTIQDHFEITCAICTK